MEHFSREAEESVLGSLLMDASVIDRIIDKISVDDFYYKDLRHIYRAILHLHNNHQEIDTLTLTDALKNAGSLKLVGGAAFLLDLTNTVPTSLHVERYATIVREKAVLRNANGAFKKLMDKSVEAGTVSTDLLADAERQIATLAATQVSDAATPLATVLEDTKSRLEATQAGSTLTRGISTGYREMDGVLTGFQPSDLIILAARPSIGKTAFALNLARNTGIAQGVPTLVFSLEMSKEQLTDRLLSMETGISTDRLRTAVLAEQEMTLLLNRMEELAKAPVYIDDTAHMTIATLSARARREHKAHKLGLIIVDYLQLMSGEGRRSSANREQEISDISRGLKVIARELNVPVIALSQLSRQVENRAPQIPQLSDLRESGSIEQNADIVAFLYRDDYYNQDSGRKNLTDLLIRKHRNGRLGTVELYFDRAKQRFSGLTTK